MNDDTKNILKAELSGIRAMILASAASASALNQTTFIVSGPVVNIPVLAIAAQAFKANADATERLAKFVEKVIDAS